MVKKKLLEALLEVKKHHQKFKSNKKPFFKWLYFFCLGCFSFGLFIVLLVLVFVIPTLPNIDNIQNLTPAESTMILDRNENVLYRIHGDENRKIVDLDQIAQSAINASMSIEDDQFYEHMGIDVSAILKAVCSELYICSGARGGSTITQQFVKNAFLSSERTYSRKLKEIILSLRLERKYSKDQILEMYLNRIPYGSNVFGVEMASKRFFDKSASELTIAEGAILASVPKAPTYYSPYGNHKYVQIELNSSEIINKDIYTEQDLVDYNTKFISKGLLGKTYTFGEGDQQRDIYIKGRVDFVLSRMKLLGYISEDEEKIALEEATNKEFAPMREDIVAPHFVMYIRELLEEKYGKEQVEKGGLKVITTLDVDLQKLAEEAIDKYAEQNEQRYDATNASLLSINPTNGHILSMVGSRDYWNDEIDGKVNVSLRPRLPGSTFKPIAYAAAFLQGYAPSTILYDVKTNFGSTYEPENFDGEFRGPVTMRQALAGSLNIPAVKSGYLSGVSNMLNLARNMGIQLNQPNDWYGLSLALGAGEARLIDVVTAYGIFANGGHKVPHIAILKVEDKNGNILEEYKPETKKDLILDPQVAYLINDILSDSSARPEGWWRDQLTIPGQINAAKTGTSNKKVKNINYPFDTWTIGYTRSIVTGVWAGNSDGKHLSLKASGLDTAGRIWRDYMITATKDLPREPFEKPDGVRWVKISKRSGKLPSKHTPEEEIESAVFTSFSVPKEYDNSYQMVEVDKVSGKLSTEFTPKESLEMKPYFTHHSIRKDDPIWEKPVREWAKENHQDEVPPTEYDDVHTAKNMNIKPEIKIKTPKTQSLISSPKLGVWVDIDSSAGINKVDYYFDNELVESVSTPPYKGTILISNKLKKGSTHTIKAIIFDSLYRSNQSSVNVKVGKDDIAPFVKFAYPTDSSSVLAGSSMSAQVEAYDSNGDIKKIDFYVDGKLSGTTNKPPYIFQFNVSDKTDNMKLKAVAYDYSDNTKTTEIDIIAKISSSSNLNGNFRIIKPSKNTVYNQGDRAVVEVYLDEDTRKNIKELILLSKEVNGRSLEISKLQIDSGSAKSYTFIWDNPPAGRHELYIKIVLDNGKMRFSQRVPVVVR